ncbi:hypothetical protein MML48_1g12426 [Holotrichia oblita]|uniref:Uncharacterized protein n=1 Tax=Holotrichia oblita TaxID=644536 RepID=A0ACB9TYG9_HOLOL|nr:hypothetical protein MML48_1g12426 [Holotrichia oblita]
MTELLVSRGDTFPRSFLDTYRSSRASEQFYNDLKSSKSDELVLQNADDIPIVTSQEINHGHSESLLDTNSTSNSTCMSPTEGDFLDKPDVIVPRHHHSHRRRPTYDRVDPEDSIRDIVTENDFYRFVLFKKHYDKYLHLSQKYEEARNIAYYLEEKYHEVKLKAEVDKYLQQKSQIEKERDEALRLLKEQAKESESTRRKLERARQEVFHHMTKIRNEKENLERENDQLKEALEMERKSIGKYLTHVQQRSHRSTESSTSADSDKIRCSMTMPGTHRDNATTLSSQFQKAMHHLATCKRRKCSVCAYTRAVFGNISKGHNQNKYEKKLFSCLQTPFLEMKNLIRPPPSPIHGEGESLSEWFCELGAAEQSECSPGVSRRVWPNWRRLVIWTTRPIRCLRAYRVRTARDL